jgi:serine/threonine protein kinase
MRRLQRGEPPLPGLFHFLRCVGKAVVKNGGKALCSLVPFGEVAFEVARDAYEDYRRDHTEADLRADLEKLAQAGQAEVRHAAEAVAAQEAADQPAEVSLALVSYLSQMPASIRQSLRRPSDPGGTTVPANLSLRKPEDLLPFLPAGLPRFKPGDRPLQADWELVELLGKGGFGEVWKARHLTRSRQRPVALKFCLDPVAAATLRNEATLHDLLDRVREEASTPGIVPLLETYLRADPPCLMYEFIEGGDLAGLAHEMQAQDRLTPEFATRVVHRLASIVAVAHRLDPPLVHRDLKLSNALVRRGDGDLPDLFVADFGIGSLAAGQAMREQASCRGAMSQHLPSVLRGAYTPLYASPQQVRGEPPDTRDDVHALGVIWYQLVTGDLRQLSIPPDWQEVVEERGLDKDMVQVLAACLASRADRRPPDAATLVDRMAGCGPDGLVLQKEKGTDLIDASDASSLDSNKALEHLAYGNAYYEKGDHEEAMKEADEAIRLDPKNELAYMLRGLLWYEKDLDRAIQEFDEIIRLKPNFLEAYFVRSRVLRENKEYDRAVKDCDEAIRLDPKSGVAYAARGRTWKDMKKYDKAIKDYDEAIRLQPNEVTPNRFFCMATRNVPR